MSNLSALLKFFYEMCLLRKNPQDLPHSVFLLQFLLLANFCINLVINLATMPLSVAFMLALLAIMLVVSLTTLLLQNFKFSARLTQTLTAIFGTDLIIAVPAIGLRYWLHWLEVEKQNADLAVILWMLVFLWNLLVTAHIIRHAIGKSFGIGLIVSIIYSIVIFNIMYATHSWLVGPST